MSSDDGTVASVESAQNYSPIETKETDRNVGRKQSIPVGNADYKVINGTKVGRLRRPDQKEECKKGSAEESPQ
jgi:hypothetical protein